MSRLRTVLARAKNISITLRILGVAALVFAALAVGLLFVVKQTVERSMIEQFTQDTRAANRLLSYLTDLRGKPAAVNGKLMFGDWVAADDHVVVDAVLEMTGSTATLFHQQGEDLVRVTTNVKRPDGSRGVGTRREGPALAAYKRGEDYVGLNPILGQLYATEYRIIRDASNAPIGIWYTGIPLVEVYAVSGRIVGLVVATALGGLVVGLGVLFFALRPIGRGIRQVAVAADGLAAGDLDQTLEIRGGAELGRMAASFRSMLAYQREMADVASAIADGDLTRHVEPSSDRDVLGHAFVSMTNRLRELVGQVKASADDVATASTQLGQVSHDAARAVQQVGTSVQSVARGTQDSATSTQACDRAMEQLAQAIDSIARGASEQAIQIQAASDTASQMAAGVQDVAVQAQSVAAASQQTRAAAEQGASAVRETVAGMAEIQEVVSAASARVEELGQLGEKIGAVVETIDDIAEQTNLLALNAAIEAARAGEHGRGFAVVADEVRKLAERSQRETKAINELIRSVQGGTREAVTAMEQGSARVEAGAVRADQAGRALEEILEAVDGTVAQVSRIADAAEEMVGGSRRVVVAMTEISAVVEESSASTEEMAAQAGQVSASIQSIAALTEESSAMTEEVSASTEEMLAQSEEMSAQAQELARTAEGLQRLVSRFQLGDLKDREQPVDSARGRLLRVS